MTDKTEGLTGTSLEAQTMLYLSEHGWDYSDHNVALAAVRHVIGTVFRLSPGAGGEREFARFETKPGADCMTGGIDIGNHFNAIEIHGRDEAEIRERLKLLRASPAVVTVTKDEIAGFVVNAMQMRWDDWVIDTGHCPPDIEFHGNKKVAFHANRWAQNVGDQVAAKVTAALSACVLSGAVREEELMFAIHAATDKYAKEYPAGPVAALPTVLNRYIARAILAKLGKE
jgi:hypothetical protein